LQVSIPEDEEFERILKEALSKPVEWYLTRAERALRGKGRVKRRTSRFSRKGWAYIMRPA
jgi:hypothetical protein